MYLYYRLPLTTDYPLLQTTPIKAHYSSLMMMPEQLVVVTAHCIDIRAATKSRSRGDVHHIPVGDNVGSSGLR
jgi:hypothetical protein